METKKETFEALLMWLTQEQKEATTLENKIDQIYKTSSSGDIDLGSFEFVTLKIKLASIETKIMHIKAELKDLAKLGI